MGRWGWRGPTPALTGYAASGDSIRGALEALADVVPLSLSDDGERLLLTAEPDAPVTIAADDEGARAGQAGGRSEFERRAAGNVPDEVAIAYHDVARDYQTGLQRASLGSAGQRPDRRALPAVLNAESAKALAERRLAAHGAGRETATLHLGWRGSALRPGMHLSLDGRPGLWKIRRWALEHMVVRLELVRVPSAPLPAAVVANPDRPIGHPDLAHGPTTLHLLDLPLIGLEAIDAPRLFALAAGVEPGWRQAELAVSYDVGASWAAAGRTAVAATMGTAETILGTGQSALTDENGSIVIALLNDAMWLEGRSEAALVRGANLALLGDELIQFGNVESLGERRFRLSRLLRGRLGTEWAMAAHGPDEAFMLIGAESMRAVDPPLAALGGEARMLAAGIGDGPDGVLALRTISGEAVRPPSPVHLAAETLANGDISLSWVRRSRRGWVWLDGGDVPLGEESEAYRLSVRGDGFERSVTLAEPRYLYTAAEQAADGATGTLVIEVAQLGTVAMSRSAGIHHIISGD